MRGTVSFRIAVLLTMSVVAATSAQSPRQFRARLSPVPLDVAMQATIAGSGTVTATLAGSTLTLTGSYKDLKSPATVVRLHRAPNKGMRGPAIADLSATKAASGEITGTVELKPDQVTELAAGHLYVQLHSEKAPEGNLWGWLLPQEGKK
jgi:hypothetical protein